jgi:hypothetical protein
LGESSTAPGKKQINQSMHRPQGQGFLAPKVKLIAKQKQEVIEKKRGGEGIKAGEDEKEQFVGGRVHGRGRGDSSRLSRQFPPALGGNTI